MSRASAVPPRVLLPWLYSQGSGQVAGCSPNDSSQAQCSPAFLTWAVWISASLTRTMLGVGMGSCRGGWPPPEGLAVQ